MERVHSPTELEYLPSIARELAMVQMPCIWWCHFPKVAKLYGNTGQMAQAMVVIDHHHGEDSLTMGGIGGVSSLIRCYHMGPMVVGKIFGLHRE